MIKPANKNNKTISSIQVIIIIAILILQYFAYKKMGVQRTLVYYNYFLEKDYHIRTILTIIDICFFSYIAYTLCRYKKLSLDTLIVSILIIAILYGSYKSFNVTKYAIVILLILINILQFKKTGDKYEKIK